MRGSFRPSRKFFLRIKVYICKGHADGGVFLNHAFLGVISGSVWEKKNPFLVCIDHKKFWPRGLFSPHTRSEGRPAQQGMGECVGEKNSNM